MSLFHVFSDGFFMIVSNQIFFKNWRYFRKRKVANMLFSNMTVTSVFKANPWKCPKIKINRIKLKKWLSWHLNLIYVPRCHWNFSTLLVFEPSLTFLICFLIKKSLYVFFFVKYYIHSRLECLFIGDEILS